ncbi:MAG: nucleotidyltransferase domain-containing protein [Boseongicola sp. SB0662_bin_57]|nr:nucleotidyltransferase domain-containing protein [Boseongicola sp. SB0662_bin_57]
MDETAALAKIRRAARATLDVWPEARAAVLFGSRARGNHLPNSDWDVAFITVGDGERLGTVPDGLPLRNVNLDQYVNEVAIPERLLERKALCIGHVERGIVTDGMILAGQWSRPEPEGMPFMETKKYERSIGTSLDMVDAAVEALAKLGRRDGWGQSLRKVGRYVACTADAAEHLAKAVMGRHGLDARHSHDLQQLGDQARKAGHDALAEDLFRMNGSTQDDHKARHDGADAKSTAHAIARLPIVLALVRRELEEMLTDYLGAEGKAALASDAVNVFQDGASSLRDAIERDGADMQPPPPHDWTAPLIRSREASASALDDTADALRRDRRGSGNDDLQQPEGSPVNSDPRS